VRRRPASRGSRASIRPLEPGAAARAPAFTYGPKFTEFKEAKARGDAKTCAAGERSFFAMIEAPVVDMKDLAINVFGELAVATFNGHFAGRLHGNPVERDQQSTMVFVKVRGDWKIVHEHFSPIGATPPPRH
jgi:ketosteroid isomerase-like protein